MSSRVDLNRIRQSYNVFMDEFKKTLKEEYENGFIKSSDYARILESLMSNAMQLAFQVPMQDYQICLVKAQITNTLREVAYKDDMVLNQLMQIQINGWAEAFKSGNLEGIPTILSNDEASILYNTIKERLKNKQWADNCGISEVEFSQPDGC